MSEPEFGLSSLDIRSPREIDTLSKTDKKGTAIGAQKVTDITEKAKMISPPQEAIATAGKSMDVAQDVISNSTLSKPHQSESQITPAHHSPEPQKLIRTDSNKEATPGELPVASSPAMQKKLEPFSPGEIIFLKKLCDHLSLSESIFDDIENKNEMLDIMNEYADLQAKSNFLLSDAYELLQRLDKTPLDKVWSRDLKEDVRTIALLLITTDIGHEWGLAGKGSIQEHEFNLEGASLGYMTARVVMRLKEYFQANPVDAVPSDSPLASLTRQDRDKLEHTIKQAVVYGNSNNVFLNDGGSSRAENAKEALKSFRENKILMIPSEWSQHGINIVLYEDFQGNKYLAYNNRGERLRGETLGDDNSDMKIFRITKEVTEDAILQMMTGDDIKDDQSSEITRSKRMQFFEGKGPEGMHQLLGLELISTIDKKGQKLGNCGLANTKGGVHAALVMILMDKQLQKSLQREGKVGDVSNMKEAIAAVKGDARKIYKGWTSSFRVKQLRDFLSLQGRINSGEIKIKPNELFAIVAQIGSKLADSPIVGPDYFEYQNLQKELAKFILESNISLKDCAYDRADPQLPPGDAQINAERRQLVLQASPGTFIVYKSSQAQLKIAYAKSDGTVVEEDVKGNEKLQDICGSKGLKYPIAITKQLCENAPGRILSRTRKSNAEFADKLIARSPHNIVPEPVRPISNEAKPSSGRQDVFHFSPSRSVLDGQSSLEKEFVHFMEKTKDTLKNNGDYACVRAYLPENLDDKYTNAEDRISITLLIRQGDTVEEIPLNPDQKILPQIEALLKK